MEGDQGFERRKGMLWQPIYTLSRNEKKVYAKIVGAGLPAYLPMQKKTTMHPVLSKGHSYCYRRETVLPMFPNYLFACIPPDFRSSLNRDRSVIRLLPVDETAEETLLEELEVVRKLEKISLTEEIDVTNGLTQGISVIFTEGVFRGATGIVLNTPQQNGYVYINVTSVESSVRIQYPAAWCKPLK